MEAKAQGAVVAVSISSDGGVPKYPQESVTIGDQGVEGDYHSGPINRHKKTEPTEPNSRQITLVAQEVLEEVNTQLGIMLKAGDLGENILVSGLDDLRQLRKGDRLMLDHRTEPPLQRIKRVPPSTSQRDHSWQARGDGDSCAYGQCPTR